MSPESDKHCGCARGLILWIPVVAMVWAFGFHGVLQAQSGPQMVLVIGSSLDAASTIYALKTNPRAHEANVLLAQGGTAGFLAGKLATTAGLTWAVGKLAPKHPRIAKVIGYGGGVALSGLAVRNVRVSR